MPLYRWIKRHAAMSIFWMAWVALTSTWVIWRVFGDNPPDIPMGTATAFGAFIALPPAAFALWKWRREQKGE